MVAITNFDATAIPPAQGGSIHPPAKNIPFQIGNTYGQENKDKTGGMLMVQFVTQLGTITNLYNLFNPSEKAVEIAKKELSALCHATGVFKLGFEGLPMDQWARELRGARGVVDIDFQSGSDKFTEVKKVYDAAGNEPGKGPAPSPQPQQAQGGGWNATPAAQGAPGGGWQQAPAIQAPAAAPANAGGWQPGPQTGGAPAGGNAPPWATK